MNAKKIDVANFDADDFFNQFDPNHIATTKPAEKVAEPVALSHSVASEEKKLTFDNNKSSSQSETVKKDDNDDVQARYEALMKSNVTAISSDMMFGREPKPEKKEGRWSTGAAMNKIS